MFGLIQNQVENFRAASKFDKHYKKFWVIKNSSPILELLDDISRRNRAKTICTYDFSTLYTKLPQDKLITQLNKVIDMVFEEEKNLYPCSQIWRTVGKTQTRSLFFEDTVKDCSGTFGAKLFLSSRQPDNASGSRNSCGN